MICSRAVPTRFLPFYFCQAHHDYLEDKQINSDPSTPGGTNRYATVFMYMSDVEGGGGHTALVHGINATDGAGTSRDWTGRHARRVYRHDWGAACAGKSGVRSPARKGNALVFYSQRADGRLDPASLHGGCPPLDAAGEKWSANAWVWNTVWPADFLRDTFVRFNSESRDSGRLV